MKALYVMQYAGQESAGAGALYVGDGHILGVDVGNCRYKGSYTKQDGRLKGTATMSAPPDRQAILVTGTALQPGQSIPLEVDWPENLGDGQPRTVSVAGRQVHVVFEKVDDIP